VSEGLNPLALVREVTTFVDVAGKENSMPSRRSMIAAPTILLGAWRPRRPTYLRLHPTEGQSGAGARPDRVESGGRGGASAPVARRRQATIPARVVQPRRILLGPGRLVAVAKLALAEAGKGQKRTATTSG
jgi:hypothetical protein